MRDRPYNDLYNETRAQTPKSTLCIIVLSGTSYRVRVLFSELCVSSEVLSYGGGYYSERHWKYGLKSGGEAIAIDLRSVAKFETRRKWK